MGAVLHRVHHRCSMTAAAGVHAHAHADAALHAELVETLAKLPPAAFAFAYGSGVVPQAGVARGARVRDFVLAVDSAEAWHAANLRANPSHYAAPLRWAGAAAIARLQRARFGAGVHFNTLLASARPFKYGVIAVDDLARDLRDWDTLYIAGRMHKPVRQMTPAESTPPVVRDAAAANLSAATAAALLSLPARFKEADLYRAAARLSYAGDVRMALRAEAPDKVRAIVHGAEPRFRALYAAAVSDAAAAGLVRRPPDCPSLQDPPGEAATAVPATWERDRGAAATAALLRQLPRGVVAAAAAAHGLRVGRAGAGVADAPVGEPPDEHGVRALAARDASEVGRAVLAAVGAIVRRSSVRQSAKGLVTAGVGTSVRYVAAKIASALAAQRRAALRSSGKPLGRL